MNVHVTNLQAALESETTASGARESLFVIDTAVARHPAVEQVFLSESVVLLNANSRQEILLEQVHSAILDTGPDQIVGIGGGRVQDVTALARLFAADQVFRRRVDALVYRHGGIVAPQPPASSGRPRLMLVPTTIGPGSETSMAACREHEGLRSVVVGAVLRPDTAIIDVDLTATLARSAIIEGAAEAALRLLGSRGGSQADALADSRAREILESLAVIGDAVAANVEDISRADRLALAVASARSHRVIQAANANPFAATHWYYANEISSCANVRKVPATMPLLPVLWSQEVSEIRKRRRLVWNWFASPLGLDQDPAVGSIQWSERWGIGKPQIDESALAGAAGNVARRWGNSGLPGISYDIALDLLRAAFDPARATVYGERR